MADGAGAWSIELSLERIRDSSALAAILREADPAEWRWLGRRIASVLAVLPPAQAELSRHHGELAALQELVRQVGMLETVVLELSRERKH